MIVTTIKDEVINMDEVVTRRIHADEFLKFEERFEVKIMRKIDLKLDEKFYEMSEQIETRLDVKFDQKFSVFEEKFDQHARNIGALIEEQNHKIQMIAESLIIHVEASERRWNEHGGLYGFLEKRIDKLEAQVALV